MLQLEPAEHLQRRKLLLPPFHGERVRAYGDLVRGLIERELITRGRGQVRVLKRP